jgi:O-antigen/teichoic acid export membrane protein
LFLRQTLLYLPAQVVGPVFQFLAVIAWTFWLAPAELGQLNLIIALQELLFLPTLYWWSHYTLRNFEALAQRGDALSFAAMEPAIIAVGLVANAIGLGFAVALWVDVTAGWPLLLAAIAYGTSRALLLVLVERARAGQLIGVYTVLQILSSAFGLGVGLALVWAFGGHVIWPLVGFALAQTMAGLIAVSRLGLRWRRPTFDARIVREALRYGAPLTLASAITWVALYGQRFIVDVMLARADVGLYSVGSGIADRSLMFIAFLVAPAVFPLAIRDAETVSLSRALARLSDGFGLGVILLVPAVAGLGVLAEPIAHLLLGEPYKLAAASLLPAAALAAGLQAAWTLMPAQTLMLYRRTEINVLIETAGAIASLVFGIILVRHLGITGAVYARVGAGLVVLVLGIGVGIRMFKATYPWAIITAALLGSFLMVLALSWMPQPGGLSGLAAQIVTGALIYALAVGALLHRRVIQTVASLRAQPSL